MSRTDHAPPGGARRTAPERVAIAVYQVGSSGATLMMIGGMYAALVWRPAAFVMLGGAIMQMMLHQAVGIIAYQRVMRRPWPAVTPLIDNDDDD
jgi:hypothetical protein